MNITFTFHHEKVNYTEHAVRRQGGILTYLKDLLQKLLQVLNFGT